MSLQLLTYTNAGAERRRLADAVICQAGNVSHGAYYVVKRYCKQHGRPCLMLKNAALSSFQKGLRVLAGANACASAAGVRAQTCLYGVDNM